MNTKDVADYLGIPTRELRQFLRSPMSTFVAVGSGARYTFEKSDLPTLEKKYREWSKRGRPKVRKAQTRVSTPPTPAVDPATAQLERDREVWDEEPPVILADIRDPRVRAEVRAIAQEQEARLEMALMRAGLHVTQLGDRR